MKKIKFSWLVVLLFVHSQAEAQWPEFNRAHPVSCQWPSFNYNPQGFIENVFLIDTVSNFYDGYLLFGRGILCHPDSCVNYSRNFSVKCNNNGDLLWWKRYDNAEVDENEQWFNWANGSFGGMIKNHNNHIVSIFSRYVIGEYFNDFLINLDYQGQVLNHYLLDSSLEIHAMSCLIEDFSDSSYVVCGWHMDSLDVITNTEPDAFIMKIDSLGGRIWQRDYSNTFGSYSVSKAIDGGFWLCANTPPLGECSDGFFSNTDFVLIKTDENGNEQSRISFGGTCGGERVSVYEYEEDKVILFGRMTSQDYSLSPYTGYFFSALIEQSDDNLLSNLSDVKQYSSSYWGTFVDFLPQIDGTFVLTGDNLVPSNWTDFSPNYEKLNGFILKLNQQRDSVWCRNYSYYNNIPTQPEAFGFAEHHILDSKPTPDGGFICCGYIKQQPQDPNPHLQTPWIFKVDSMGCLEPGCQYVNVEEIVVGLENTITVFPNPASDQVKLNFTFPDNYVPNNQNEIVIIDMQGREVLRENIFLFASSSNTIEINISSLSSGMYTLHWLSNSAWLDSSKVIVE
jgi:hypothetical protein